MKKPRTAAATTRAPTKKYDYLFSLLYASRRADELAHKSRLERIQLRLNDEEIDSC